MTTAKPMTPAFARRLWFIAFGVASLATLIHGATLKRRHHEASLASLEARTMMCTAALQAVPVDTFGVTVYNLQRRYHGLIAVATLDAEGRPAIIYPPLPSHRAAAAYLSEHPDETVIMTSPYTAEEITVAALAVPLGGAHDAIDRYVLVLLETNDNGRTLSVAIAMYALTLCAISAIGAGAMHWWFDRRIADPLQQLARSARSRHAAGNYDLSSPLTRWTETCDIENALHAIRHEAATRESELERVEFDTEQMLRKRQMNFDKQLRRAQDHAAIDPLTKLRNRSFIEQDLEPLFRGLRAAGQDMSAVMIDLDNFKIYNDTKGHQAGDELLRFVGTLLSGATRPTDHAVRYGGDEFVLLLPGTGPTEASVLATRIIKLFGQYTKGFEGDRRVSLSAGIASISTEHPKNGAALLAKADAALYAAKRGGKSRAGIAAML